MLYVDVILLDTGPSNIRLLAMHWLRMRVSFGRLTGRVQMCGHKTERFEWILISIDGSQIVGCKSTGKSERSHHTKGERVERLKWKAVPNWWSGQLSDCANSISCSSCGMYSGLFHILALFF